MGLSISGPDTEGKYTVKGTTFGFKVVVFFGILFMIVGLMSIFVNPIAGAVILLIANLILFANNTHKKNVCQKLINEYAYKQTMI